MIDLKEFRKQNKITQVELAKYLDVLQGFVSQIENGNAKLPEDKLNKLLDNPHGWDTSMLTGSNHVGDNSVHAQVNGNGTANAHINYGSGDECAVLKERVKCLERIIEEKERLIGILLERKQ